MITCLLTNWATLVLTYLLTHSLDCLLTCLLPCLLTDWAPGAAARLGRCCCCCCPVASTSLKYAVGAGARLRPQHQGCHCSDAADPAAPQLLLLPRAAAGSSAPFAAAAEWPPIQSLIMCCCCYLGLEVHDVLLLLLHLMPQLLLHVFESSCPSLVQQSPIPFLCSC